MTIYATGVDYSNPVTPPRVLLAHGARFACRYASEPGNPKNLTADEARALSAAGIDIVSVFETTAQRALDGYRSGADDAHSAWNQLAATGMPAGRPIYFTVDFDMQVSQEQAVAAYFDGVASELGVDATGVYGGKRACEFVHGSGRAGFVWQTYAWSGGVWAPVTHLRQVHNGIMWDGWSVDLDEAWEADYGGWRAGAPQPPQPPQPPANWTEHMISNMPQIQNGSHDPVAGQPFVHRCQALLTYVAGDDAHGVDGIFGPHTEGAVKAFQAGHGLTVDGIVGPHTWGMLVAGQAG